MADVTIRPIQRLLVANRGEIARRIFRTAREMGKSTIAVFADGDAREPFVEEADIAFALRGQTSRETYLDTEKVLHAAKASGADAIHPGYGFLSENPEFAQAVMDAGMVWIGPPVEAIRHMGDKLAAKTLMQQAGVPTLHSHEIRTGEDSVGKARDMGYPLLVKAAAGGGGKGMRVVESEAGLAAAIESARREAGAAFGDDTVFLEHWLAVSRHVEIQIMGDLYGNLVHYFDRECSIQRRHQKIIEEAPSPAISDEMRLSMGEAAIAAARQLNYSSAGTVEFLVDGEDFWFLEVNTRLQVEHPVTEEITERDLVAEQIRIAEGEPLEWDQEDVEYFGHAIEARLYAEDPSRGFLPSPGRVERWKPCDLDGTVRFDSGIESGSEVSMNFDPMIAKVIAFDETRRGAAERLARALERTQIAGLRTNRDFLVATLRTPEFLRGETTTDFIDRVAPATERHHTNEQLFDAVIAAALQAQRQRRESAQVLGHISSGWRNSHMPPERAGFRVGEKEFHIEYRARRDGSFEMRHGEVAATVWLDPRPLPRICLTIDDRRMQFDVHQSQATWHVHGPAGDFEVVEIPRFKSYVTSDVSGGLAAPMPGKVLTVEVDVGNQVEHGQVLAVLEAMKMEHRITAPSAGIITKVHVKVDDQVEKDIVLIEMDANET